MSPIGAREARVWAKAIRRLACRGGVKRISGLFYDETWRAQDISEERDPRHHDVPRAHKEEDGDGHRRGLHAQDAGQDSYGFGG
ncbi:hypothetical protein M0R45_008394 [Rubus argutus]|uniref:PH domain-containing protein n=1 Tax=Rubus argutus TaxID=59490 RepID=A0AAW1Y2Z2_RUBAR